MSQTGIKSAAPYLMFNGRCEEAIDFYKSALGAKVENLMRFSEVPPGDGPPISEELKTKIIHAHLRIGASEIMASDGMCTGESRTNFDGFSLALTVPLATAEPLFDALAAGGNVTQPLVETFFAPKFGVVSDKFGVSWMIVAEGETQA